MTLVSVLGLWANKNTFINRNGTSGEMLDSLDARDISLRLEDQGVHNLMCRLFCLWQNGGVLKPVRFRTSKVVDRSEARSWLGERMAMLVSILGLWANKNTFINRNGTSGEMLDSLDARDISLRLEDQGVHSGWRCWSAS